MRQRPQPWFVSGLRFCGSCLATVLCWALWLVLGATLAALAYIAVAKELPVPGFVLRRVEAEMAKANLTIRFGRASLEPTGQLLLEDVQLRSKQFEDPLVRSRLVYVRRSIWSVLGGRPVPDEIRLEGATLQLPAMLSPSGVAEPLVRDFATTVRHQDNVWEISQLIGRIGPLTVTAQGALTVPVRPAGAAPFSLEEMVASYLKFSRQIALGIHRLDALEEPSLAIRLENPEGIGNIGTLLLTARGVHLDLKEAGDLFANLPLATGPLAATTTIRLDGPVARTMRLHAAVREASLGADYRVDHVRAILSAQLSPEGFAIHPVSAWLAAGTLSAEGESALGPVLQADLANWPDVHTTVMTQIRGEFLSAEVEAALTKKTARIRAAGRASGEAIDQVLARHLPRAAPFFVFGDPVNFTAEAQLGPEWKFASLASRVDTGRIDSRGVKLTAARGRIDIIGMDFLAHDARLELGDSFARGSYWMNFATTDYRMLLDGRLNPPLINGWFIGPWWLDFWNRNFAFTGVPPNADVDVNGRWRDGARTVYFGRADAKTATVLGGDFEDVHTLIFLRPTFTHGIELNGARAAGAQQFAGSFQRRTDPLTHETNRLEFAVDSNLEPAAYRRMAGGRADAVLDMLRFTHPPRVHAEGAINGKWPGAVPEYTFRGAAEGGLHFYGFPLETVAVTGAMNGTDLKLTEIQFTTAGGKGVGKASLDGPADKRQLGFDVAVTGADLARTIRAFGEYEENRSGDKKTAVSESEFMKRASGGRLDVSMSAYGTPGDLPTFTGSGNAALTGTELAEIHLFGLLSQVLSGLSLNFSSLKLDAARTSFKMDRGRLYFPDLKISGPSAVIDARGDYTFATNALDFTAKFKPFEEKHTLLTIAMGIVVNPIASILELKLSGPLNKPDWSIVVGPSSPKPESPPAPAPAPDQGAAGKKPDTPKG